MTVYVSMPLIPGVIAIDDAELEEVQSFFQNLLASGETATFNYPGDNQVIINMSRIPYINVRPFKLDSDDEGLGLLQVSFTQLVS